MANLAWGIERMIESPIGRPLNRAEAFFRARQQETPPTGSVAAGGDGSPHPRYRLSTEVPDYWIPLLPVKDSMGFQRGSNRGQGEILKESTYLCEEEVPREGARVTRAFQYARWIDGEKTYLWAGRWKGVGRGEGSSGLKFDVIMPSEEKGQ